MHGSFMIRIRRGSASSAAPDIRRLAAVCGIAVPIISVIVMLAVGYLHPGYSIVTQRISELGAAGAPYAIVMNLAGLIASGVLLMVLSLGLYLGVRDGRASMIGAALLALSGAALVMTGIFTLDAGGLAVSGPGMAHGFFARIGESAIIVAALAMSFGLRKDKRWHALALYSLMTAVVATALYLVTDLDFVAPWKGVVQRLLVAVPLMWIEVMSVRLLFLS